MAPAAVRKRREREREAMGLCLVDGLEIEADDYWAFELAGLCRLGDGKEEVAAAARKALTQWRQTTIQHFLSRVTSGDRDRA